MKVTVAVCASLAAAALACAFPAAAQTVKIGLISTYSGPGAAQGDQIDKGVKLYMKLHADKLPPGVKIELITRDDTGPNGDVAKRIAQELIVRDKVQILTGVVWTPNMAAIAPLTAEAKVPFVSANAAGRQGRRHVSLHDTPVVHSLPVGLSAGAVGRQEVQESLLGRQRFRAGSRGRGLLRAGIQGRRRRSGRHGAHPAREPRLRALHAAHQGRQARRPVRFQPGRQAGYRDDESLRRPRHGQGQYQIPGHRRHHHRRGTAGDG